MVREEVSLALAFPNIIGSVLKLQITKVINDACFKIYQGINDKNNTVSIDINKQSISENSLVFEGNLEVTLFKVQCVYRFNLVLAK